MTVPARVTLVTLGVADVARAATFYEALGWRRSSASTEEVAFFRTAGAVLALWGARDLAADAGLPAAPAPDAGFRGMALAINVESAAEVDRALEAVASAGGRIVKAAAETDWGGYSGYFADLDGHLWEVAHNPFWPLEANGSIALPE